MKKVKLLVVAPYFYPKIGGLENYAFNISKGLKKQFDYEVVIITSNHEKKEYKEETIEGMKIYRLPGQFKISNTPISFKWKKQIKNIIQKEKPDVINAHTPVPFIADVACRIAKKKKIPFYLTYHNDLVKDSFLLNQICKVYYLLMGNKTLNQSTKIIATSEYYAENSPYLKKRLNKIEVVSPGVDLSNKKKFNKIKNQILFVGQLDKTHVHKGLNYLIDSINLVKREIKDIQLIVVGSGDNLENYKEYTTSLNLDKNIKFLGRISDEELSSVYSKSEICVLPSYNTSEGFGMVLIEGMAHKCVAIGTNVGGIPYAIGNAGIIVAPKNSKILAKEIIDILKNPKKKRILSEAGYKKVRTNFTWDKKVRGMNKIIFGVSNDK